MSQAESAQKQNFDPFELWRQFYDANEQAWTKAIKEMTTTKDYAEAQGKMLESMLAFQKMMREGMSSQLNSLNVPTRDDVARLGELVLSLEEKIDQLDDRIPGIEKRLGILEKKLEVLPAVEKKVDALASIEKKLDGLGDIEKKLNGFAAIEKRFDALDTRLAGISSRLPERVAREVQKEAETASAEPASANNARPRSGRK